MIRLATLAQQDAFFSPYMLYDLSDPFKPLTKQKPV